METQLIKILKALGNETRLRILNLLQNGDLCVCELQVLLNQSQSNISKHLNRLTSIGILNYYQSAKYIYYQIDQEMMKSFPFLEQILVSETKKLEQFQDDRARLAEYKGQGYTCDDLKKGKVDFTTQ